MNLTQKLKLIWTDTSLRNKILFVLGALVVFRMLANIPIPGVDALELKSLMESSTGGFLSLLDIFSGGGLSTMSIVMLGVGPYITAAIIMQLLTMMSPRIKEIQTQEGEIGRMKIAMYSRLLSVPLAAVQGFGLLKLLESQGVLPGLSTFDLLTNLIIVVAGSVLLMWIGELISEFGIGNGVSLVIFAGIISSLPGAAWNLYQNVLIDSSQIPVVLAFVVVAVVVIAAIVFITEAERPVPVQYTRSSRAGKQAGVVQSYMPLRLNQAGVIPIIFALSVMIFPQMVAGFMASADSVAIQDLAQSINAFLSNTLWYGIIYFILVVLFTYFYTAVTFDPSTVAERLQKSGAFVPGIRPGGQTEAYLGDVMTKITLFGALFLGVVAVLPIIIQGITGYQALAIGGTGVLIVVSVLTDLIKKIEAQITMREY
ncbi:MAG: preprotein translocase subunit SecY [Patescibacteria group bacterium]